MEKVGKTLKKNIFLPLAEVILATIIATGLCYVGLLYAYILPLLLVLIPIPCIYLACKRGIYHAAAGYILTIAALWVIASQAVAAVIGILILPPIWIISRLHLKNRFSFETVLKTFGSFFLGVVLVIVAVWVISGQNVMDYILDLLKSIFLSAQKGTPAYQSLVALGHFNSLDMLTWENINTEAFINAITGAVDINKIEYTNRAIANLQNVLGLYLALMTLLHSMVGGFICYALSHKILQKAHVLEKPLPPFRKWSMPRSFGIAAAIMLVVSLIGTLVSPDSFYLAYSLIRIFVFGLYAVQGASLIMYFFSFQNNTAMGVLLIILLLLVGTLLPIVGMADHLLNIRTRLDEAMKNNNRHLF